LKGGTMLSLLRKQTQDGLNELRISSIARTPMCLTSHHKSRPKRQSFKIW
jgi:hypothetical protein